MNNLSYIFKEACRWFSTSKYAHHGINASLLLLWCAPDVSNFKVENSSELIILDFLYSPVKGVFSFSFRVDSDIAPAAQLLVYAILPNGEIVADTEKLEIENCFANKVGLLWKQFSYTSSLLKDEKEEIVSI